MGARSELLHGLQQLIYIHRLIMTRVFALGLDCITTPQWLRSMDLGALSFVANGEVCLSSANKVDMCSAQVCMSCTTFI